MADITQEDIDQENTDDDMHDATQTIEMWALKKIIVCLVNTFISSCNNIKNLLHSSLKNITDLSWNQNRPGIIILTLSISSKLDTDNHKHDDTGNTMTGNDGMTANKQANNKWDIYALALILEPL